MSEASFIPHPQPDSGTALLRTVFPASGQLSSRQPQENALETSPSICDSLLRRAGEETTPRALDTNGPEGLSPPPRRHPQRSPDSRFTGRGKARPETDTDNQNRRLRARRADTTTSEERDSALRAFPDPIAGPLPPPSSASPSRDKTPHGLPLPAPPPPGIQALTKGLWSSGFSFSVLLLSCPAPHRV